MEKIKTDTMIQISAYNPFMYKFTLFLAFTKLYELLGKRNLVGMIKEINKRCQKWIKSLTDR